MKKIILTNNYLIEVDLLNKVYPNSWYYNPIDLIDLIPINYTEDGLTPNEYCVLVSAHRPLNGRVKIDGISLLPELKIESSDSFPIWFDGSEYRYR